MSTAINSYDVNDDLSNLSAEARRNRVGSVLKITVGGVSLAVYLPENAHQYAERIAAAINDKPMQRVAVE